MPRPRHGQLEPEFEYIKPDGDAATVLMNVEFSYTPGGPPGGTYDRWRGGWDPPDPPEWEIGDVILQRSDGTYQFVNPGDWFWEVWVEPWWFGLEEHHFADVVFAGED